MKVLVLVSSFRCFSLGVGDIPSCDMNHTFAAKITGLKNGVDWLVRRSI